MSRLGRQHSRDVSRGERLQRARMSIDGRIRVPFGGSVPAAFEAIKQAGRYRAAANWASGGSAPSGAFPPQASAVSDYLFAPFDDQYAPYYTTQVAYEKNGTGSNAGGLSTGPVDYSASSDDVRKNGEFYKISETAGVQHMPRN